MKKALLALLVSVAGILSTYADGIVFDTNQAQIDCNAQVFHILQKPSNTTIYWNCSQNVILSYPCQDSISAEYNGNSHYEGEPWIIAEAINNVTEQRVSIDTIHLYTRFLTGITLNKTACQYSKINGKYYKQYAFKVTTTGTDDLEYFWCNTDSVSGSALSFRSSCTMQTSGNVYKPGHYTPCSQQHGIGGGIVIHSDDSHMKSLQTIPYVETPLTYAEGDPTILVVTLPLGTNYSGFITVKVRDNCCHTFEASKGISDHRNSNGYIDE